MTELDLVVRAVCALAEDYRTFGDRTTVELVRRSGYLRHRADVSVDRLAACLAERPEWVASWFAFSEDGRGTPRWYLRECGPTEFEVGSVDGKLHSLGSFADRVVACAEYVHRELARIAEVA